MIVLRTEAELERIDRACALVRMVLDELIAAAAPGVATATLDRLAEQLTQAMGARPAFKGYLGYPASVCVSINEQVVHGIPGSRVFEDGDLVSLDFGVLLDGYFGDSAVTFGVGELAPEDARLSRVTREALMLAAEEVRPGRRVSDIGHAVEQHAAQAGFGVVREFVGHGIGARMHEEPQVPNYGRPGQGPRIEPGMVFALEPMIAAGAGQVRILDDGWTAVTADGSKAAHWELVVAATADGPRVLGGSAEWRKE